MGLRLAWTLSGCARQLGRSNEVGWSLAERLVLLRPQGQYTRRIYHNTSESTAKQSLSKCSRTISTLNPESLRTSDFVDFSGIRAPSFIVHIPENDGNHSNHRQHILFKLVFPVFPKEGRGFLYYHIPHGRPPISGELRFRITPTSNPESFHDGYDMTRPNGFYWRIQLAAMPLPLRKLAIHDQLITQAIATECDQLNIEMSSKNLLHYLEQPFLLDFAHTKALLWTAKEGKIRKVVLHNPLMEWREVSRRGQSHSRSVYKGKAVVRFELSTLPEHSGADMVVIRILKILQPVEQILQDYDGYIEPPAEGSLIGKRGPFGERPIFAMNIGQNNTNSVGLKVFLPPTPTTSQSDRRPRRSKTVISTLDPGRIQASDVLTIAGTRHYLSVAFEDDIETRITIPRPPTDHTYRRRRKTCGFLYYHRPSNLPEAAGEIRLRVTPTPDPSTFNQGRDLMNPDGSAWNISLLKSTIHFKHLCQILIRDQLITPSLLLHCQKLVSDSGLEFRRGARPILHVLEQPFRLDFSRSYFRVFVASPEKLVSFNVRKPFYVDESGLRLTGRAWVRFEEAPFVNHSGKRPLALRLLKTTDVSDAALTSHTEDLQPFTSGPLVSQMTPTGNRLYRIGPNSALRFLWLGTP